MAIRHSENLELITQSFSFSQRCCWSFMSSGLWNCVVENVISASTAWRWKWRQHYHSKRREIFVSHPGRHETFVLIECIISLLCSSLIQLRPVRLFIAFKWSPKWSTEKKICCILSFGWFPGVWNLCADVTERTVSSIFLRRWNWHCVPKRRLIKFRRRGITQMIKNTTFRTRRKFEIKKKIFVRYVSSEWLET